MKNFDEIFRSTKPEVQPLPADFSKNLMQRIADEDIQILAASKVNKLGKIQLLMGAVFLIIGLILFNYNSYELRMNGSLELLFFGSQYLMDFVSLLPWDLILPSLLLTGFSVWFFWRSGLVKKGIAVIAIVSYLITGVGGAALATTGFNDRIDQTISENEESWPWLNMFHHHRAKEFIHHPNFKMGRVESVTGKTAQVITPTGKTIEIKLPESTTVQPGQILRMSGKGEQAVFTPQKIHVCNPQRTQRYFMDMKSHMKMMKPDCCSHKKMMMH